MQGAVKGGRRQGRQRKRWGDNIRDGTSLEFGRSQRAVENKEKWRKLVAKSSARYYTSYTKTKLPTRKSVLRFSRHPDHTKT